MDITTMPGWDKIDALQAAMVAGPTLDLKVVEYFSEGVYARELHIPAGTVVVGKIHKHTNFNVLSKGSLSILQDDGSLREVTAPFTVVSPPGTRRVAYAHDDCVWTTVHGTDLRDVAEIEAKFIAQTPEEYRLHYETTRRLL